MNSCYLGPGTKFVKYGAENKTLSENRNKILRLNEITDGLKTTRFEATGRLRRDGADTFLHDWSAALPIELGEQNSDLRSGQLLKIEGNWNGQSIELVSAQKLGSSDDPEATLRELGSNEGPERAHFDRSWIQTMRLRASLLDATRAFFKERRFEEVQVPTLIREPGVDPHISLFETEYIPLAGAGQQETRYLHTSPELMMKRYLVSGAKSIFYLGPVFRNGEQDQTHIPEFTMAEWYQVGANLSDLMDQVEALIQALLSRATAEGWAPVPCADFTRFTVQDCFLQAIDVDPLRSFSPERFEADLLARGLVPFPRSSTYEQLFHQAMVEGVEEWIHQQGPCFVHSYPAPLALLSRLDPVDQRVGMRVEAYFGGQELANGFEELTDAHEQERRFLTDLAQRSASGAKVPDIPRSFIKSLHCGMPPTAGIAFGLDRFIQVVTGKDDIWKTWLRP